MPAAIIDQASPGLVEQQQPRFHGNRPTHLDEPLLAVGQRGRLHLRAAGEAEEAEHLHRAGVETPPRRAWRASAARTPPSPRPRAGDAPQFELHEDPQASAREVANPVHPAIVEAAVNAAAHATGRFFERRTSVTMRTPGSPKMPTTVGRGRKPGKRYESERRRRGLGDRIPQSCHVPASAQPRREPLPERVVVRSAFLFDPLKPPKSHFRETFAFSPMSYGNEAAGSWRSRRLCDIDRRRRQP